MELHELTYPQKTIWYMEKLYPNTGMTSVSGTFKFNISADFEILEKAINIFVKNNSGMRLQLKQTNEKALQYIAPYESFRVDFIDFSSRTKEEMYEWEENQAKEPLNGIEIPLFKFIMMKMNENESGVYIKTNHIISDAWSMMLLSSEVTRIYSELINGKKEFDEKPQYLEYLDREKEYLKSDSFEKDEKYWNEKLSDFEEVTVLKEVKLEKDTTEALRKTFLIPSKLSEKMKKFCEENKVSEYALFISALAMYINRAMGKENLVFGTSLLNRINSKEKETIGMYASTAIPLKINITEQSNFETFVKQVAKEIMGILRHQRYPYQMMLQNVKANNKTVDKLFDIVLNYQNAKGFKTEDMIDFKTRWHFNGTQIESLIVNVNDRDGDGKLIIDYDFLKKMFAVKEIEFIHQHIVNILWHAIDNPKNNISNLEMLSESEKQQILVEFNDSDAEYDKNVTIHELFEKAAAKYPNNTAVKYEDKTITYKELNEKANSLARALRKAGLRRQDIITVIMYKSINTVISTLAILKSGGAYLPIDPDFPVDRRNFMIKDCSSKILLTEKELKDKIDFEGKVFCLDDSGIYTENTDNLDNINEPGDLLYIIYTSGSTGNPKGVMLEHGNVVRLMFNSKFQYDFNENDVWTMFHSYCFDFSVWEMYGALLYGGKLIVVSKETSKDLNKFVKLLRDEKVTVLNQTPAMFYNVINEEIMHEDKELKVRYVIFGGEALNPSKLKPYREKYPECKLVNMYGITETTVHVTFKELTDADINAGKSNIGKPIPTLKTYIMDKNLNLLPIGIPGEICVAGAGVARGYLNQKELTDKKFVINPYNKEERLYRSGDLGRFYPKGDIEYLGRIDTQVKVRGFRVEIGEIERNILSFNGVKDTVVIPKKDENEKSYLVAYLVCINKINLEDLRIHLQKFMPVYMVPSYFVFLDKLPLTVNGKINRKALPEPQREITDEVEYAGPRNKTDEILQEVWKDVLKNSKLGIDNNFFNMGGDSLSVINTLTKLYKYNFGLAATDFYKYPTIRELSDKINDKTQETEVAKDNVFAKVPALNEVKNLTSRNMKNVMVTGATGFLGSHIVKELLDNTESNVYCLVRGNSQTESDERFEKTFNFYFGNNKFSEYKERVKVIKGDVTLDNLGIESDVGNTLDNIIHTAALVKYYGQYSEFEKINIGGVRNVMKFAKKFNVKLNHISTIGISGSYLVKNNIEAKNLTENELYVGQNYSENAYVKTKFEAENMLLNEVNNGLKLTIFRMGNLTGRYNDGYFQKNVDDNAFYNILKSIIKLKKVSKKMDDVDVELTPVDMAARCVVNISNTNESDSRIFHITNYKEPHFDKIREYLNEIGFEIGVIENDEFIEYIKKVSQNDENNSLRGIIADMNAEGELDYDIPVKATAEITTKYLKLLGFEWPDIEVEYIRRIVNYLKSINYFKN